MRVHIIGTGLLGASLGLALSAKGHQVTLEDTSPTAQQLAADLGAGQVVNPTEDLSEASDPTVAADAASSAAHPDIVVVATPPDVAARVIASALEDYPNATVNNIKLKILSSRLSCYVGCGLCLRIRCYSVSA